jgi:hypothetical protein
MLGRTPNEAGRVTGHDLARCGKTLIEAGFGTGHDLARCGKTPIEAGFVTGHDFSRAETASTSTRALAPATAEVSNLLEHSVSFGNLFNFAEFHALNGHDFSRALAAPP